MIGSLVRDRMIQLLWFDDQPAPEGWESAEPKLQEPQVNTGALVAG